jgi:hypothetical protein
MTIGIITTCYTYYNFLPEWSDSIIRLNRKPDKVVIATTNPMHQEILNVENKLSCDFEAVRVSSNPWNFANSLNAAIHKCNTDWIVWIGCDDLFYPHALDGWENSKYDVINFGLEFPDKSYVRIQKAPTKEQVLDLNNRNLMPCGSPFRRYLWENIPFQSTLSPYEDWAFGIGAAIQNAKFGSTGRVDFMYRIHPGQIKHEDGETINNILKWKDKILNG